ncbi:hypothetical protein GJ496_004252 [Pomphorhynchus laevis]|nr:hypothetical protein GJ496_004252 [Pomphorhynchus laevis]
MERESVDASRKIQDQKLIDVNTAALPSYSSAGTNNSDSNERRLRFKSWQAASKIKNTVGIAESMHLLHKSQ